MKFSIVTPVLNGAGHLSSAIASLAAQSHQDFEHLIVDGGSDDGSIAIARTAAAGDQRVRLIEAPGRSQYAAIAEGFDAARGEVFSWLNADDLYTPWALAAVARRLEPDPDIVWVSGFPGRWDEAGVLRYIRPEGVWPRKLIARGWFNRDLLGFLQQESMFFRASLYRGLSPLDRATFAAADLAGDFILWKRMARRAYLHVVPTALGGFRRHGANRSHQRMDAYMAEARKDGAPVLPRPLTGIVRRLFWMRAAWWAVRASHQEDRLP